MEWPRRVQGALSRVPGVECAHVDFEAKMATVVCDPDTDRGALIEALQQRGYDGVIE
jgi:copper chaperone CopZ